MANILEKYGIKEVADVTFYDIKSGAPVLYLDTLKVSTIEQTAENVSARGGKGNPELIIWDYNKEITVTLEDALFSAKSMAVMFGNDTVAENSETSLYRTMIVHGTDAIPTQFNIANKTVNITPGTIYIAGTTTSTTSESREASKDYLVTYSFTVSGGREIVINSDRKSVV